MEDQNNTNPEEEKGAANNDAQGQNENPQEEPKASQSTGGVAPVARVESVVPPTGAAYASEAS